jgi:hypothetical protein
MPHIEALEQRRGFWHPLKPNFWLIAAFFGPIILVAYMNGWSIVHKPEVKISGLREQGACLRFEINNLLQDELVMERATLKITASIEGGFAVSNTIPLRLAGALDSGVLLQPGDTRSICLGLVSKRYKEELFHKLKSFAGLTSATCRFRVIVRRPSHWHGHFYARAFDCAEHLPSLFD